MASGVLTAVHITEGQIFPLSLVTSNRFSIFFLLFLFLLFFVCFDFILFVVIILLMNMHQDIQWKRCNSGHGN